MKYFWINLDNAETRREKLLNEFKEHGVTEHFRVSAYLSPKDPKRYKENACARSHIQAITHFLLNTNDECALICEDDLTFECKPYWRSSVEDIVKQAPNDWGILQLATIIQNIEPKFGDRELYFKWRDQKSSACLAYVIKRKCAIELVNMYLRESNIYQPPTPDCFSNGIYQRVDRFTKFVSYTYKYPMFVYPDENDTQLDNSLDLHVACKRQLLEYLKKHSKNSKI